MKDLFLKLVQISSPSGHEEPMWNYVGNYLDNLGVKNWRVKKNLLAHKPGTGVKVLLCAHVDTVQKEQDRIIPIVKKGVIESDGSTILGADNKAGVSLLLKIAEERLQCNPEIYFAFTGNEEAGRMTAWDLPINKIKPDLILNIDGGKKPGIVDIEALGQEVFEMEVIGKAAHAALEPEKGVNALLRAVQLVYKLKLGKRINGDTLNIGVFKCEGATNVVPDKVIIKGEMRSFSKSRLNHLKFLLRKMAKVKFLTDSGMPVWEKRINKSWSQMLSKAAVSCGLIYKEERMYASSDANVLSQYGIPTYSINRGGKNPHSNQESITLQEMEQTKQFIMAILKSL